jgi:PhnB protein
MTSNLAVYIALPGTTAEAMRHWHEVFGGELNIMTYGDTPMPGMPFEPDPDDVAHAVLTLPGGTIAGADSVPDERDKPVRDTVYSLLYTTDTPDEARELIARLVDGGGNVNMDFEQAPWGGWYGQVFDRYGVMWAFSCE